MLTRLVLPAVLCAFSFLAKAQTADMVVVNNVRSNANLAGSLAFLNFSTGKVTKTIPVGNEPHEVCISDDKRFALVTNTGSYQAPNNTLSLIDLASQTEKYKVDLGALWNPHGVIYHNGLFYFTADEGAEAIFIVPDGKTVMVSVTNENAVAEIDLDKMEVTRKLTDFKGPDAMGWIGQ